MLESLMNFILAVSNLCAAFASAITLMNIHVIKMKHNKLKQPILLGHGLLWMLFACFVIYAAGYSKLYSYMTLQTKDIFGSNYFAIWLFLSPAIFAGFVIENLMKIIVDKTIPKNVKVSKTKIDFTHKFPLLPSDGPYSLFKKWNHFYQLDIVEYEIKLKRLHHNLDGLLISFISDTHFGRYHEGYLHEVINLSNSRNPDIVLFGGDMISREKHIQKTSELLKLTKAKHGKFAVLGNHDYWTDGDKVTAALENAGFKVLKNHIGKILHKGQSLRIFGIDSPRSLIKDAKMELKKHHDRPPEIVLTHNPDHFAGVHIPPQSLLLAGHTHGGQIQFPIVGPLMLPSSFNRKYTHGIYRRRGNIMMIGKGIGGDPPFRFRCNAELIFITLKSGH